MTTNARPQRGGGLRHGVVLALSLLLLGCEGPQSALQPMSRAAREVDGLWWVMFWAGVAIFGLVLALTLIGLFGPRRERGYRFSRRMIVAGGVVLPVVALSVLLPFGAQVGAGPKASKEGISVRVIGHQWWWSFEYRFGDGRQGFTTANELHLPVGEPVELLLTSQDVIHSLWIPRLAGKLDLIPGRTNRLVIEADSGGIFRGQCAEFCGLAHALMAFLVVASPPEEFAGWAETQRAPAVTSEATEHGAELFHANGCALCHTVRGHGAWGVAGPDLTHVGSRRTIGAGLLDNTPENIAYWLAHNDAVKPGNQMPEFADLSAATRLDIASYLAALQ